MDSACIKALLSRFCGCDIWEKNFQINSLIYLENDQYLHIKYIVTISKKNLDF
jgi:hypothetical protein